MIKSIRHKGQAKLHASGTTSGIQAAHVKRLRLQLAALDTAQVVEDLNIPGFGLHPLKGMTSHQVMAVALRSVLRTHLPPSRA